MPIGRMNSNCIKATKIRDYCKSCDTKMIQCSLCKRATNNRVINKRITWRCFRRQITILTRESICRAIEILKIKFYQKTNSKVTLDPKKCQTTGRILIKMRSWLLKIMERCRRDPTMRQTTWLNRAKQTCRLLAELSRLVFKSHLGCKWTRFNIRKTWWASHKNSYS